MSRLDYRSRHTQQRQRLRVAIVVLGLALCVLAGWVLGPALGEDAHWGDETRAHGGIGAQRWLH